MKKSIIIVFAIFFGMQLQAQRAVEKTENVGNNQEISVDFKFANDIRVEQWNKNEVLVKAQVTIDDGEGDSYFSLKSDRSSNQVKIYSDFGGYFKKKSRENSWGNNNNTTEIDYVVYVPNNATIRLKSISGSVEADSFKGSMSTDLISGNVTIKQYQGEMTLKTVSGDLDVTMNKARVDARTVTGTIYSDLDIDQSGRSDRSHGGNKVIGKVNNGDVLLVLKTVSGNIYMRKG